MSITLASSYEITPAQLELASIGRDMMDAAIKEKDDRKSNQMSNVGSMLCAYGAPFGTRQKDFSDSDMALVAEFMKNRG
jgi:hypothetical protein